MARNGHDLWAALAQVRDYVASGAWRTVSGEGAIDLPEGLKPAALAK